MSSWKERTRQYILEAILNYKANFDFGLELCVVQLDQAMQLMWLGTVCDDPETSIFLKWESWPVIGKHLSNAGKLHFEEFEIDELFLLRRTRNDLVHELEQLQLDYAEIGKWIWLAVAAADQANVGFQLDDFEDAPELLPATKLCPEEYRLLAINQRVEFAESQFVMPGENRWAENNADLENKWEYINDEQEGVIADIVIVDGENIYEAVEVVTAATLTMERGLCWVKNLIDAVSAPWGYQAKASEIAKEVGFTGDIWWYWDIPSRG